MTRLDDIRRISLNNKLLPEHSAFLLATIDEQEKTIDKLLDRLSEQRTEEAQRIVAAAGETH